MPDHNARHIDIAANDHMAQLITVSGITTRCSNVIRRCTVMTDAEDIASAVKNRLIRPESRYLIEYSPFPVYRVMKNIPMFLSRSDIQATFFVLPTYTRVPLFFQIFSAITLTSSLLFSSSTAIGYSGIGSAAIGFFATRSLRSVISIHSLHRDSKNLSFRTSATNFSKSSLMIAKCSCSKAHSRNCK